MEQTAVSLQSMLLSFRAENVRSFRDEFELDLRATPMAEPAVVRSVEWREDGRPIDVLPVVGIFGANASGKSNVLEAMADMQRHVRHSFRSNAPNGGMGQRPFRLDTESIGAPSSFEVTLILDGIRHEYGFAADHSRVLREWAYRYPRGRAVMLFDRDGDEVALGTVERARSRAVLELLRPNALFLSTAASANHPVLLRLYDWFDKNFLLATSSNRAERERMTMNAMETLELGREILPLLRAADLGISGASKQEVDPEIIERLNRMARSFAEHDDGQGDMRIEVPAERELFNVRLTHSSPIGDIDFDLGDESFGTVVWFSLLGMVVAALTLGSVLLVDELDASLHPSLVEHLVMLFQDPETNPHNAQLVFNAHDYTMLGGAASEGRRLLGRDQIWFTEKLADGSSRLYPLADLSPRKEEAIARRYRAGRYGAIPILSAAEFAAAATGGDRNDDQ